MRIAPELDTARAQARPDAHVADFAVGMRTVEAAGDPDCLAGHRFGGFDPADAFGVGAQVVERFNVVTLVAAVGVGF